MKALMAATVAAQAGQAQETQAPLKLSVPTTAPVAPAPVPWMRGLLEAKPLPMQPLTADAFAETITQFFSASQRATLKRLSELFQPPYDGYPGATEAGAPEFLDFLIGASPEYRQRLYTSGLDRLDAEAKKHFGKSFGEVDDAQADQLIRPWLHTWMNDHPPVEPYARFINLAHADIRTATMNSQAWADAALKAGKPTPNVDLYWYPVDPDLKREEAQAGRRPS
jgi:hypothetical protein